MVGKTGEQLIAPMPFRYREPRRYIAPLWKGRSSVEIWKVAPDAETFGLIAYEASTQSDPVSVLTGM